MEKALKLLLMDRHELGNPKIVTTEMFNEAIAELEEAMKPKTCEVCKHYSKFKFFGDVKSTQYCHENGFSIRHIDFSKFCCNKFEPKDNA